jgi:hypothetical protein
MNGSDCGRSSGQGATPAVCVLFVLLVWVCASGGLVECWETGVCIGLFLGHFLVLPCLCRLHFVHVASVGVCCLRRGVGDLWSRIVFCLAFAVCELCCVGGVDCGFLCSCFEVLAGLVGSLGVTGSFVTSLGGRRIGRGGEMGFVGHLR